MVIKKRALPNVFLASNFLIVFMCLYVYKFQPPSLSESGRVFMPNVSVDIQHARDNVSETGYMITNKVTAIGKNIETEFDTELIYQTAKTIHDHLYNVPVNQTCKRKYPTCILLGVFKCGTREMMDFFSIHPNVQIKRNPYEFGYFINKKYGNSPSSLDWYRQQLPCIYDDQVSLTKHAGYFADPRVPGRMYKVNKDTKLLLMVRDPVQRFISHVWFQYKTLSLPAIIKKINDALRIESVVQRKYVDKAADGKGRSNLTTTIVLNPSQTMRNSVFQRLLKYSVYDEPYVRYMKYFKKDQLLVIESEEFKKNPAEVLSKLETFLDIPNRIQRDMFVYNSRKKYFCIKSLNGTQVCYSDARGHDYKKNITSATIQKLKDFFRPHNERFFSLLGRRFDHWL